MGCKTPKSPSAPDRFRWISAWEALMFRRGRPVGVVSGLLHPGARVRRAQCVSACAMCLGCAVSLGRAMCLGGRHRWPDPLHTRPAVAPGDDYKNLTGPLGPFVVL